MLDAWHTLYCASSISKPQAQVAQSVLAFALKRFVYFHMEVTTNKTWQPLAHAAKSE